MYPPRTPTEPHTHIPSVTHMPSSKCPLLHSMNVAVADCFVCRHTLDIFHIHITFVPMDLQALTFHLFNFRIDVLNRHRHTYPFIICMYTRAHIGPHIDLHVHAHTTHTNAHVRESHTKAHAQCPHHHSYSHSPHANHASTCLRPPT